MVENSCFFADLRACRGHPRILALLRNSCAPGEPRGGCSYFEPEPGVAFTRSARVARPLPAPVSEHAGQPALSPERLSAIFL